MACNSCNSCGSCNSGSCVNGIWFPDFVANSCCNPCCRTSCGCSGCSGSYTTTGSTCGCSSAS